MGWSLQSLVRAFGWQAGFFGVWEGGELTPPTEPMGCSRAEVAAFENFKKELRGFTQAAGVDSGGSACYLQKTQQAVEA